MTSLKMKQLLTVVLLLFLWQGARCATISLTNKMDVSLKFAKMAADNDEKEKEFMILAPKQSGKIAIDVAQGERLWVAYHDTIFKLPKKKHYRTIKLPDNNDCHVDVVALPFLSWSRMAKCTFNSITESVPEEGLQPEEEHNLKKQIEEDQKNIMSFVDESESYLIEKKAFKPLSIEYQIYYEKLEGYFKEGLTPLGLDKGGLLDLVLIRAALRNLENQAYNKVQNKEFVEFLMSLVVYYRATFLS